MSADGTPGTKGNPQFDGGGAPATATDMNLISTWAADRVGEHVANYAALPSSDLWVGRLVTTDDTEQVWLRGASGWKPVSAIACALRKSANQNLTTTAAALTWDVEISDPAGMHSNVTNNTRIVAPVAGLYEVSATVFNSNTSGYGAVQARLNGTTDIPGSIQRGDATGNSTLTLVTVFPIVLAANDYVEIMVLHSTAAGNISGGTSLGGATVTMKRLGPA